MKKIAHINSDKCPQNHACPSVRACPVNALTQTKHEAPTVHADVCIGCGRCVMTCPMGALFFPKEGKE